MRVNMLYIERSILIMLSSQGFNLWADNYDQTVELSEENNRYPFAGYKEILNTIYNEVMQKDGAKILDIGVGTAVLTSKLYEKGYQIDGIDFSSKMLAIAEGKMPQAHLMEWDIRKGIPPHILNKKYDSIISTYTLHHLTDKEKIPFINKLLTMLNKNGKLFIGDISFENRTKLKQCREDHINYRDEDEFYFVYDEIKDLSTGECKFYPFSHCGGLFILSQT